MVNRRDLLKSVGVGAAVGLPSAGSVSAAPDADELESEFKELIEPEPYDDYNVHRVGSGDSIQDRVDSAEPNDLVLVEPGVYNEEVEVHDSPSITIRGLDRNEVVLDGENTLYQAITVTSDNVAVENMTARDYREYGFYWTDVDGYRASYLTSVKNRAYGIYGFDSENGLFEESYAMGSDDAGFYIGQSKPANAVIRNCVSENNAMGYSGTNAGGNLTIEDSEWKNNFCGLVPNTLDGQRDPPQRGVRIQNNSIHHNNNLEAPAYPIAYPALGNGVLITGGTDNLVQDNEIYGHSRNGVAVVLMLDENLWLSRGNVVRRNTLYDNQRTDLALGFPARGNQFSDNEFSSSRPAFIEGRTGSIGDPWVTMYFLKDFAQTSIGDYPHGSSEDLPEPDDRPGMGNPEEAPPRPAIGGWEEV